MKQSFYQWCKQFVNEDSPIGDLAKDNLLDPTFPDSDSYNELYDYLVSQHASDLCLQVFDKAWNLYTNGGIKMTFKDWILNHSDYSKYGSLAVDIESDKAFPNTDSYLEMIVYLIENNVGDMSTQLFKEAYEEYKQEVA